MPISVADAVRFSSFAHVVHWDLLRSLPDVQPGDLHSSRIRLRQTPRVVSRYASQNGIKKNTGLPGSSIVLFHTILRNWWTASEILPAAEFHRYGVWNRYRCDSSRKQWYDQYELHSRCWHTVMTHGNTAKYNSSSCLFGTNTVGTSSS